MTLTPPIAWPIAPRGHRDKLEVARKMSLLDAPHVKPLNDWVRELNRRRTDDATAPESMAPWFDPSGGGVNARILFLLEAPGSRSSASRGSGIISIDNNDGTAANCFNLMNEARLRRPDCLNWNIVPWYLPAGTRTRATRASDVVEATRDVEEFLALLPTLELVIPMGTHSTAGWNLLRARSHQIGELAFRPVPHPSATNLNTRPEQRDTIRSVMQEAAELLARPAW